LKRILIRPSATPKSVLEIAILTNSPLPMAGCTPR
jgi:hypothetical protein